MKRFIIFIVTLLSLFFVFKLASDKKINYISIGDSLIKGINSYGIETFGYNKYVKSYLEKNKMLRNYNDYYYNYNSVSLTEDINNNKTYYLDDKEYFFKKILRESDLLVISIGMDEIAHYFSLDGIDKLYINHQNFYNNIQKLIKEVKKYAKNNIIFIGYYNPLNVYTSEVDEYFYFLNNSMRKIMNENNVIFLDIYEKIKSGNYLDNPSNHHLNIKGYQIISDVIIECLKNTCFL